MSNNNQTHNLLVQASTKHLAEVRDFVATHAFDFGFGKNDVDDIRLAVDEAYTNIIKHAYQYDDSRYVEIVLRLNSDKFIISLLDNGQTFDPSDYTEPDVEQQIKEKKRGGVGVYLIRKLMDNVEYRKQGPRNEIRMIKKR